MSHQRRVPFREVFPDAKGYEARPVYYVRHRASFSRFSVQNAPPIVLNTIPKSGTYLYVRLLERLGAINTGVHLSRREFWDFRDVPTARIIAAPDDFRVFLPFEQSVRLVNDGQFAVGHVDHYEAAERHLRGVVHLFCVRDLREVLVSHMRFMLDPRRASTPSGGWWKGRHGPDLFARYLQGPGGSYFRTRILPITEWRNRPEVDGTLRFETIMGDDGVEAQRSCLDIICEVIRLVPSEDPLRLLKDEVIGAATRTYSGSRSVFSEYASYEVLGLMKELGVDSLNSGLGYPAGSG